MSTSEEPIPESIADNLHGSLPKSAEIVDRSFDTALVDLGTRDGVAVDDELVIVKRGELGLARNRIGFSYDAADVVGTFVVRRIDELVSEGQIERDRFFDLVNIGDRLVYPSDPEDSSDSVESANGGLPNDLYRSIISIR